MMALQPLDILRTKNPLPADTLMSWVRLAECHGFDAILPLIEKEGIDIVKRTLRHSASDWLFLTGVSSWRTALLIGSDLGAPVEALKSLFEKVVVIEPHDLVYRLLEVRFNVEISTGCIELRKELEQTDIDLDFLWFTPTIGRSEETLLLTKELKSLLQDCTHRLAPGGILAVSAVRDRGVFRDVPLPGIRHESGRGYSLRELEQVFPSRPGTEDTVDWYWLTSHKDGRSSGTALGSRKAIMYCVGAGSKWFRFLGPLNGIGASFVTNRVSSLMLTFRKSPPPACPKSPIQKQLQKNGKDTMLERVMRTVRDDLRDKREFAPLLYRSGSRRRNGHAKYLLIDAAIGRPTYIVRISKSPESEMSLQKEHESYRNLRRTNRALQSLSPVHYVISETINTAELHGAPSTWQKDTCSSFSIERFFEGSSGAAFRQQTFLDNYSLDWLNWFQTESATATDAVFDNEVLCRELSVVTEDILRRASPPAGNGVSKNGLSCRIPQKILKPLIAELLARFRNIGRFRMSYTAVHGDFCQVNLLAYKDTIGDEDLITLRKAGTRTGMLPRMRSRKETRIHVFDWEYLQMGVPLLDPWLYALGYMYLGLHGQADPDAIFRCLTGTATCSGRIERCVGYYAAVSALPIEVLAGYLPMVLLVSYARELASGDSHVGRITLLEQTVLVLALRRSEVWQYLDALTDRLRKEVGN